MVSNELTFTLSESTNTKLSLMVLSTDQEIE